MTWTHAIHFTENMVEWHHLDNFGFWAIFKWTNVSKFLCSSTPQNFYIQVLQFMWFLELILFEKVFVLKSNFVPHDWIFEVISNSVIWFDFKSWIEKKYKIDHNSHKRYEHEVNNLTSRLCDLLRHKVSFFSLIWK